MNWVAHQIIRRSGSCKVFFRSERIRRNLPSQESQYGSPIGGFMIMWFDRIKSVSNGNSQISAKSLTSDWGRLNDANIGFRYSLGGINCLQRAKRSANDLSSMFLFDSLMETVDEMNSAFGTWLSSLYWLRLVFVSSHGFRCSPATCKQLNGTRPRTFSQMNSNEKISRLPDRVSVNPKGK